MCVRVCERGSRVGMTRNDERTIKNTYETCHITVMTSYKKSYSTELHWNFSWDILGGYIHNLSGYDRVPVIHAGNNLPHLTKTFSVILNLSTRHNEQREVTKALTDLACRMVVGRRFLLWRLGSRHCPC